MGGGASRWRRIAFPCASFSSPEVPPHDRSLKTITVSGVSIKQGNVEEIPEEREPSGPAAANKILCAICLESLTCSASDDGGRQRVFTAQCAHSFHFVCIASNVRHGSVTCPICRAYWTDLPRELTAFSLPLPPSHQSDPILRILDDSIATSRINRRSFLRSTRYDDDDPVDPSSSAAHHPRLHLALLPIPPQLHSHSIEHLVDPCSHTSSGHRRRKRVALSIKLSHQQATDLVLVVSPNGPHLRLLKQSMALVVFSLRAVDRLAIVTCSTTASRAFPLRRMSPEGKRVALHVIDRLFYLGDADPTEGIRKGVKILDDRTHHNPLSCILHVSDRATRGGCIDGDLQEPIPIHRFFVGYGFGESNGLVMHEFEDFLARLLGGVIREIQLRVGEEGGLVRLGELRVGEERRVPLDVMGETGYICVGYSYVDGAGAEERLMTGEVAVGIGEKSEGTESESEGEGRDQSIGGRSSSVERWDYLNPFMARRWAKHLHGYKA